MEGTKEKEIQGEGWSQTSREQSKQGFPAVQIVSNAKLPATVQAWLTLTGLTYMASAIKKSHAFRIPL